MKARGVVGKRIVRIDQTQFFNKNTGKMDVALGALVLEDGTRLIPLVIETEYEPVVDLVVNVRGRRQKR